MDEFICISCWKEFTMAHDEVVHQQGKVVCPNCGYILQVDASETSEPTNDTVDGIEVEQSSLDASPGASDLSEVIDWGAFSGEGDGNPGPVSADTGQPENTGSFPEDLTPPDGASTDLPPPIPDDDPESDDEIGFEDPAADEKTPFEPVDAPAILLDLHAAESAAPAAPVEWRLKTSSGLTFRFTDPDALLGWKKKINIYREMHVSPNGEDWVDYVFFVKRFEACGDAVKAFRDAGKTTEELLVLDSPPQSSTSLEAARAPVPEEAPAEQPEQPTNTVPTTQFTFRTADKQGSRGKQALLLVVGLALGAGAAWLALTYLGIINL